MRHFYTLSLLALLCLFAIPCFSQKDAPVTGNSATLCDLLKKDYNSVDPDGRRDAVSQDMALVTAIFKSYLADADKSRLATPYAVADADILTAALNDYNNQKKEVAAAQTITTDIKDGLSLTSVSNAAKAISDAADAAKKKYYDLKYAQDDQDLTALQTSYQTLHNAYISYMIGLFIDKFEHANDGTTDVLASANSNAGIQKGIPFIGGDLSFDTAIEGLAQFLAKRLKEELTAYVIDRVKTWLQNPGQDDPLAEFKVLLPQTTQYLSGFTADKITNFPSEIKQYIQKDLDHLLENAPNLRNTPRMQKLIATHPDLDFALEALEIIPGLSKIKTPVDYFNLLENSRNLGRWKTGTDVTEHNIANTIYMAGMVARSLVKQCLCVNILCDRTVCAIKRKVRPEHTAEIPQLLAGRVSVITVVFAGTSVRPNKLL